MAFCPSGSVCIFSSFRKGVTPIQGNEVGVTPSNCAPIASLLCKPVGFSNWEHEEISDDVQTFPICKLYWLNALTLSPSIS